MDQNIRQRTEQIERQILSKFATLSEETKGRQKEETKCTVRTDFQRDRDRIIHSNSFRRLKHKTQVFIAKEGDHYRERLTHTLEVMQIARTIARGMRMNEDLTEAIALGHDLGHTPFGHTGENVLSRLAERGFAHNEQSLRVVDRLEKNGLGLNLTFEVRDGILNHRTALNPSTPEGRIVRIADKIAYINHDIDDAIRSGLLKEEELPKQCIEILGTNRAQRINAMIIDILKNSRDAEILMSKQVSEATSELRDFLFERIYLSNNVGREGSRASRMLELLYRYYTEKPEQLPEEYLRIAENEDVERAVCDYIAGMTDNFAIRLFRSLYVPGESMGD